MEVVLLKKAKKDRDYWKQTGNEKIMKRITSLLKDIEKHPFTGLGKPEPLKGNLQGKSSGSRVIFKNGAKRPIMLHKPHPGNIVKGYAMKQVYEELKEAGLIK